MTKIRALALLAAPLLLLAPISAAEAATPDQVGLVSVVGATKTTLTLNWSEVDDATSYQVWRSTEVDMSGSELVATSTSPTTTLGGMNQGQTYCFQVRAMNGSTAGRRSPHTCKPTVAARGRTAGPIYRLMTFNVCSKVCSNWSGRAQAVQRVIQARRPDVLATQEAGALTSVPTGYHQAYYKSAKRLFYKASRFSVASSGGKQRAGYVYLGGGHYAVWAELVDHNANNRHVIFVDVHTAPAFSDYAARGQEVSTLLRVMSSNNRADLPIVYLGDFNSNKSRGSYNPSTGTGSQDSVATTFHDAKLYDAFDLARHLSLPNWSSAHTLSPVPKISHSWGDHVDHVFVDPSTTRVRSWANASLLSGGSYATPMPSDHSPLLIDIRVN